MSLGVWDLEHKKSILTNMRVKLWSLVQFDMFKNILDVMHNI